MNEEQMQELYARAKKNMNEEQFETLVEKSISTKYVILRKLVELQTNPLEAVSALICAISDIIETMSESQERYDQVINSFKEHKEKAYKGREDA